MEFDGYFETPCKRCGSLSGTAMYHFIIDGIGLNIPLCDSCGEKLSNKFPQSIGELLNEVTNNGN